MKLTDLARAVAEHSGQFVCERIHKPDDTKIVTFRHVIEPPLPSIALPDVGRLRDFHETFGSILFYYDEKSGEAGKYLASHIQWEALHDGFSGWIEDLDEEERAEILPDWIDHCLVIGESPHTGNYVLMPVEGEASGRVFEFDHDGFEFVEKAENLVEYVQSLLALDSGRLTEIASHMRFIENDPDIQWWICELRDNRGNIASTAA